MIYLTKNQIVTINKLTVSEHGGSFMPPFNFLHETALDYLVEVVHSEIFGQPMYASISKKSRSLYF